MALFEKLFVAILFTLEEMGMGIDCNRETSKSASSFYKLLHDFHFVVALVVTRSVLDRTLPATQLLQTKSADILDGLNIISSLKDLAINMQISSGQWHEEWYARALSISSEVNIVEAKRRTCNRQVHRSNPPYTSISDFYYKTITQPLLDHLSTQLQERFDTSIVAYQGLALIPSNLVSSFYSCKNDWKKGFMCFVNLYLEDFPNFEVLEGEIDAWESFWVSYKEALPNNVSLTLQAIKNFASSFPNFSIALKLLATLPITSCECERSFSSMKRLKNYSRSTMSADRLNGLALLYIHQDVEPDVEEVINSFARMSTRRIEFL
jgi:hypothetical protein